MFTNVEPVGQERFVLSPFDLSSLSEEVKSRSNPVGASPAPPVDHMLKEMIGIPLDSNTSTFIVGFD